MKFIIGKNLGTKVRALDPNHIMVAYVGMDWKRFIPNPGRIQKIIIQPNPPTNHLAVRQIVSHVTWDCVRFMSNLHAKVYLNIQSDESGKCSGKAIVGSPNLTDNGLGGNGLYEAATEFDFKCTEDGDENIDILGAFDEAWELAGKEYPDCKSKEEKLRELEENNIPPDPNPPKKYVNFCKYEEEWKKDFWPVWYTTEKDLIYSDNVTQSQQDRIRDRITISGRDVLSNANKTGYWILQWKITQRGTVNSRAGFNWMYVHEVIPNALDPQDADYTDYSTLLVEYEDLHIPAPPFSLDKRTQGAIKDVLNLPEYSCFNTEPSGGGPWSTQQINDVMDQWLADIRNRLCP